MPERAPTPERLAELYDLLDPWDPGDDLHLGLVMAAPAVLDVVRGGETMTSPAWDRPHTDWATLRFVDASTRPRCWPMPASGSRRSSATGTGGP
jgi:hypothetical protein